MAIIRNSLIVPWAICWLLLSDAYSAITFGMSYLSHALKPWIFGIASSMIVWIGLWIFYRISEGLRLGIDPSIITRWAHLAGLMVFLPVTGLVWIWEHRGTIQEELEM